MSGFFRDWRILLNSPPPERATTLINYECGECGTLYPVWVDKVTFEPEDGEYGPCTYCGRIERVPA